MTVGADDIRCMARLLGIQIFEEDVDAIAAIVTAVRQTVDRAHASGLEDIDPFIPSGPSPGASWSARPPQTSGVPAARHAGVLASEATDLTALDIAHLAELIRCREISPVEVTRAYLAHIEALNGSLRAYITVTADRALAEAAAAESEIARGGGRGPLHGVPIAYKDMILTRGIRTTFHSRVFADCVPDRDAAVVERLSTAGTIMLGKANTYELGAGDGDLFGLARNPWDATRQPGGSSSGSGVAVAAGLAAGAVGTDAGGSIRVPAAFCGVVGLKPTYGWVSRYPEGWCTVTSIGPMTRTALDAALMMDAMAGPDPRDEAGAGVPASAFAARLTGHIRGVRVGVADEESWPPIDAEVQAAVRAAVRALEDLGARVEPVSLPHAALSEVLAMVIAHVECYGRHRRFLVDRAAEIGTFFRRALTASQFYTARDYMVAQRVRRLVLRDFMAAHAHVDAILTPTVPYPPFRFGETALALAGGEVNPRTGMGRFTRWSNLTGFPAVSVPCGFTSVGLPVAFQLMGRAYEDGLLLNIAHAYQQATAWHRRRPPLAHLPASTAPSSSGKLPA